MELYPRRRANVLWVFGDQHRAQACGYRGDTNLHTLAIDTLARNGMRFDRAVAGTPWCCPFRAALLTGRYPHQVGVVETPAALDPSIPTVTTPFREAGYHTAYFGKWHLDGGRSPAQRVEPERRGGLDHWLGFENNNNQHESYVHGSGCETPRRLPGYEIDALTDLLIDHLGSHVGGTARGDHYQPFFAVLSVQLPHNPYVAPHNPAYPHTRRSPGDVLLRPNVPHDSDWQAESRLDPCGYYGMVENLDYNLGRIRRSLAELGVDRETYVAFFSDHGDMLGSHGQRGKSSPWEESVRIPFIVGTVGGGVHMRVGRVPAVVNHVDIPATTLGLCGLETPEWMVGYDYARHVVRQDRLEYRGEPDPAREPGSAFLQQIPRKLHMDTVHTPWRGVVTRDDWKYVCTPGHDWLLHHVATDPYEQANHVFNRRHQVAKERCHRELSDWIRRTGDDFLLPDIRLPSGP